MIYADDSAEPRDGWMVYGWVEIAPADWAPALREWLEFRKKLWRDYAIPVHEELHTTQYANGRKRISKNPPSRFIHGDEVYWKDLGREVAPEVLAKITSMPLLEACAVARHTTAEGSEFAVAQGDLYSDLVALLDTEHRNSDELLLISMDGDGTNKTYFKAHRALKLATRSVIEDPMFHESKRSQWTQMADAVAYAALAKVNPHAGNEFAWNWWDDHVASKCYRGDPFSPPRIVAD